MLPPIPRPYAFDERENEGPDYQTSTARIYRDAYTFTGAESAQNT